MIIFPMGAWMYYINQQKHLDAHRCGKWMYFFNNLEFVARICSMAVEGGVVSQAKHSAAPEGVACFYLHGDDVEGHQKVIRFLLKHDLIKKTKEGKLYNISFKYDDQTRANMYGENFKAEIKLEDFIDLHTGELR